MSETERLKLELAEEKAKAEIASEFANFGLWEYVVAEGCFISYKNIVKFNRIEPGKPYYNTKEIILKRGCVFNEDLPEFNRFCDTLKTGGGNASCEIRMVNDESENIFIRMEARLVRDENGLPLKYLGRTLDITGEKSAEDKFSDNLDPLTGAYNLAYFKKIVKEKRSGANCYNNAALFSVAIDKFHEISAKSGANYADYVQKTVAKILIGISVCERDCFTAKVRDGEFLMFMSFDELASVGKLAKQIIDSVKNYIFDGDTCTVSIGVSVFKNAMRLEDVFRETLAALGEAKRSGGCCYMNYSPAMSLGTVSPVSDTGKELDTSGFAGGEAMVYALILKAFCDKNDEKRRYYLKEAFKTAGELLGASAICVYVRENGALCKKLAYNASEKPGEDCPGLKINCSENELNDLFWERSGLRIQSGDRINGAELLNGAVCAECRAVKYDGKVSMIFAVIFSSSFELNSQDIQIIDALENALAELWAEHCNKLTGAALSRLNKSIFADHRIEGFSLIPGEYRVEIADNNAAEHYGLKSGDICYKKIYGRDTPCDNCPTKNLEKGELHSSNAIYFPEERRWHNVAASIDANEMGKTRFHISATDITECLGKVKISDTLTGLMTFDSFTAEALRITNEEKNVHRFAVVMNIADFRRINDEKGFETGNSILIAVSGILRSCIGTGELICRSEGSRFIMLFRNNNAEECLARINLIMASVQKQVLQRLKVTIYLVTGIYDMESDEAGVTGGIDRAIRAQKTIRDRLSYNENMTAFFDEALREKIREHRFIEANMASALENNEFQVFYQPKISIETGRVVGAEALARWIRPTGEVISPAKFVPIFEANGFITDMDFAVYRKSVADIKRWLRIGINVPLISINVSRHHIGDDSFCTKLNSLVDTLGVPHKYIELEITESLLTDNIEKLIEMVSWFKERGYKISVDDFGSGYSSLNLITMLPFDTLKIDGGFFLKNDLNEKNRKVITSVVTLAKSLNLETVSEGVETQGQVDFLKELGCDMVQGFFYYKPMPCSEFEEILKKQTPELSLNA